MHRPGGQRCRAPGHAPVPRRSRPDRCDRGQSYHGIVEILESCEIRRTPCARRHGADFAGRRIHRRSTGGPSLPTLTESATAPLDVGGHGHDADGSIGFEHGQLDLGEVADLAMLSNGGDDLLFGDALAVEVGGDDFAALDENDGDTFDELTDPHTAKSEAGDRSVRGQQGRSRDEPSLEAGVGADHGVLYGVGYEKDHHEIERGQLAEFPTPTEAEANEDSGVDDERPSDDLDQVHELGAGVEQIF